jgi:hypothetical protein
MLVISNNLIGTMPISDKTIIRINLAWFKDTREVMDLLNNCKNFIYLDFPSGRTKPPKPRITLKEAIELTKHPKVKYFAMSNCENEFDILEISNMIGVEFIPKIETEKGVENMRNIQNVGVKTFMLDKEDLYIDVGCDSDKYNELVEKARRFNIIELQGVVFK